MIGKKILNYEIKSVIGEGGMGNVYLGEHMSIGRKVAIKSLRPELSHNEEIKSRFKNEASVMAKLQHQNIVGLIDYVDNEDGLFLIMEYVEGQGLNEILNALKRPMSIERSIKLMKQILNAFAFAHQNGIVHRDVKPENILIKANDEVKVLDFGIAKLLGDSEFNLTKTGTQVGTVYYMSPEQVKAEELDHRSDIYSLGITFYEVVSGFCPYRSLKSEFEVYNKIVHEPLTSLVSSMGEEYVSIWNVIEKATEKKPSNRYSSCEEFSKALEDKTSAKAFIAAIAVEKPLISGQSATEVKQENKSTKRVLLFVLAGIIGFVCITYLILNYSNNENNGKVDDNGAQDTEAEINNDVIHSDSLEVYENDTESSQINETTDAHDAEHSSGNEFDTIAYNDADLELMERVKSMHDEIIDFPDVEAGFPGGPAIMQRYIARNVIYPQTSIEMNEQGRVYLSFIVEVDGSITHVAIERGVSQDLDREAKRVVRNMPKWKPGEAKGKAVRTRCRLPIKFTIG